MNITNPYHAHLDVCTRCTNQPFNPCEVGAALLKGTAFGATTPTQARGIAAHAEVEAQWSAAAPPKRRVWLIGESNPYGSDPEFDLYPSPRSCAGWRMYHFVLGLDEDDYLDTFERRNLLRTARWSAPAARAAAEAVAQECARAGGAALVLLGAKVAAAFGQSDFKGAMLREGLLTAYATPVLVIPHPSGLSRAWNEPDVTERVRAAVLGLVHEVAGKVT